MALPQQSIYADSPRPEFMEFIPASARSALDVGCGAGGFGRSLRQRLGASALIDAIDPVLENVKSAGTTHGYDHVMRGYFPEDLPDVRRGYDLVTFIDVLEHMLDPWDTLRATRDVLNPGGRVLAGIPNIQLWTVIADLLRGRWDYTESGILDRTHVRFFTRETMREMFVDAGYTIEVIEGVNDQRPALKPLRNSMRIDFMKELKWLPRIVPESRWLHYVVVARLDPGRTASDTIAGQ